MKEAPVCERGALIPDKEFVCLRAVDIAAQEGVAGVILRDQIAASIIAKRCCACCCQLVEAIGAIAAVDVVMPAPPILLSYKKNSLHQSNCALAHTVPLKHDLDQGGEIYDGLCYSRLFDAS